MWSAKRPEIRVCLTALKKTKKLCHISRHKSDIQDERHAPDYSILNIIQTALAFLCGILISLVPSCATRMMGDATVMAVEKAYKDKTLNKRWLNGSGSTVAKEDLETIGASSCETKDLNGAQPLGSRY